MISTVTTTTVTTIASTTMAAGFGLLATMALIVLLITKELAGSGVQSAGSTGELTVSRALDRVLSVAIVPLLFVFGYIVIVKIIAVLR
ncbi:hypothetical protein [Desulfotomaculum copahuensis]|uniref:Protein-export membrane protein SecG n=1 Tax=Desulfotomaculum copahuensis TaxID=1838280 RepID=A0A1B7LHY6_9FIRM|nr:hypothetical protein [Desulfotomaculum copahuensis]OAT85897.1 hypothetical protein A6M21_05370 [Desulfotomaculum copahuensis]